MRKLLTLLLLSLLVTACGKPERPTIPLYLAVQRGDLDQVERHMYWGSDMEALNPDGQRPLHVAAAKGNVVMVRKLLQHGVKVDAPDAAGRTALQLAILAGRTQVADELLSHGAKLNADALLIDAARQGNPDRDVVRYLVRHGADLQARNATGDTALLIAIRGNHLRLARHLVDNGADVNIRDASGRSALGLALQLKEPEMAALLKRYGAVDGTPAMAPPSATQ
jgi:ankyrin repeat protein